MKLFVSVISFLCLFIFISCEEDFSPKSQFREFYVLNCVIGVEDPFKPTAQIPEIKVLINKIYDGEAFTPPEFVKKPLIHGAYVSLTKRLTQYILNDTVKIFDSTKTPIGFYLLDYYTATKAIQFNPLENIKLSALLPDGKILTSETIVPQSLDLQMSYNFPRGITPKINQFLWGYGVTIEWETNSPEHLFFAQMKIPYHIKSIDKFGSVDVPLKYIDKDGKKIPLYPSAVKEQSITFEFAAMDSALSRIALCSPIKDDIEIGNCEFKIMEFDTHLSNFYSSTNGYMDSYSVRLDDNTYSNIRGGFGIFGSYYLNRLNTYFDRSYILELGFSYRRF